MAKGGEQSTQDELMELFEDITDDDSNKQRKPLLSVLYQNPLVPAGMFQIPSNSSNPSTVKVYNSTCENFRGFITFDLSGGAQIGSAAPDCF